MNRAAQFAGKWLATYLSKEMEIKGSAPPSNPLHLQASLRPGDVLLVEGNTRLSTAIKYLTQSTWSHAYSNSCRFVLSTCAHITQLPGSLGSIEAKSSKSFFVKGMDFGVIWRGLKKFSLPTTIQVGPVFYLARYPSGVNA